MSETGAIESIDTANMQKIVNIFTQRHAKLDFSEEKLEEKLIEFTEYSSLETDEKEKIPLQFLLKNHYKFKEFSIPVSRAMWSSLKVGGFLIYDMKSTPIESIEMLPIMTPTSPPKESISQKASKVSSKIKSFAKLQTNTPESRFNEQLLDIILMQKKWRNIIHWYELCIRKRPKINTRKRLDQILENIIIAFNVFVEPTLLMTVHFANELTKIETEQLAQQTIASYLGIRERHRTQTFTSQPPQLTQI